MELQKRDRGSVRTAKDIERKYNLGRIIENGRKADMASEQIDKLLQDTNDLEKQFTLIQELTDENKQNINQIEENVRKLENSIIQLKSNTVSKEDLEDYYTKEELDEKIGDLKASFPSFVRRVIYYEITKDFEDSFRMPGDYEVGCLVDVFLNGLKLEKSKYSIDLVGEEYFLNLEYGSDVVGTFVEIDIIEGIKEGEL